MLAARVSRAPLLLALLLPLFPAFQAAEVESDVVSAMALPAARKARSLRLRRAAPQGRLSLAQAAAAAGAEGRHEARAAAHQPKGPGWFGDFSQMESTYTDEGKDAYMGQDPERVVQFGYDLGFTPPDRDATGKTAEWFDESPSAGSSDAWQTHYPAPRSETGAWRNTFSGWVQNYKPAELKKESGAGAHPAEWFDSSVLNYDGFGRRNLPYPGEPRRLLETDARGESFLERAVNTTIACAGRNCTATTNLQAFDAATEEARNCRLNIGVHATDYDNDWSKEAIKDWTVNGYLVNAACDPRARGCNNSAWRPLYSCLNSLEVDHIVDKTGALKISGSVSKFVDECPYEGNLLSGVVMVTCMVRPIPPPAAATPSDVNAASLGQVATTSGSAKLLCAKQGCEATTELSVDPQVAMRGGTCRMNVTLAQTDFDDTATEQLEFLKLGHEGSQKVLSPNSLPGANPCNLRYAGQALSQEQEVTNLITDLNVTQEVLNVPVGLVMLSGKISDSVDECASDGNLLDATVTVRCDTA